METKRYSSTSGVIQMHVRSARILLLSLALSLLLAPVANAVTSIPAGSSPYTILANPVAHEVYVANIFSDNITVIDSVSDSVAGTITVGPPYPGGLSAPVALAHNPVTNKLYCVNYWSYQLAVIDVASKTVEATITLGWSHIDPRAVVVNPLTNMVYVTSLGQPYLYVIDGNPSSPTYNQIVNTVTVGMYPRSLALNTNLARLYVANTQSANISVVDVDPLSATYNQVTATIPTGLEPYALALNHSDAKLYVTNRASNTVTVIDSITNTVRATLAVGTYPRALDVNPETNLVYVANRNSNTISVIDGASNTVTRTIPGGVQPYAVAAIRTQTGNAYVANYGSSGVNGTVTTVRPDFSTEQTTVGLGPAALTIDTLLAKPKVFTANYSSNDVSVIDPEGGSSSLVTHIDALPGDVTATSTPTITGSSQSLSMPFASKILKIYYSLDDPNGRWREAEITSGQGTSSVTWSIEDVEPLSAGSHTIRVFALDVNGATIVSSDGFGAMSPSTGDVASYTFSYQTEALGSISGIIFDDHDGDGNLDASDSPLDSWPVSLEGTSSAGERVSATSGSAADGRYSFTTLPAGTYALTQPMPQLALNPDGSVIEPGWTRTAAPAEVVLSAGEEQTGADFAQIRQGWMTGTVTDEYTKEAVIADITWIEDGSSTTSSNGVYWHYEVLPNGIPLSPSASYTLALTPPAAYLTHEQTKTAVVSEGAGANADFSAYRSSWSASKSPQTASWWRRWDRNYSTDQMQQLLGWAQSASGLFGEVTVDNLSAYLSAKKSDPADVQAKAHLLAAWLNVVSGRLGLDVLIDVSAVRDWQLVLGYDIPPILKVDLCLKTIDGNVVGGGMDASTWLATRNILVSLNDERLW